MEITEKVAAAFTALEKARRNYFAGIAAVKNGEIEDTDINKLRDELIAELDNCRATFDKS
jgi:hypothetical protein